MYTQMRHALDSLRDKLLRTGTLYYVVEEINQLEEVAKSLETVVSDPPPVYDAPASPVSPVDPEQEEMARKAAAIGLHEEAPSGAAESVEVSLPGPDEPQ